MKSLTTRLALLLLVSTSMVRVWARTHLPPVHVALTVTWAGETNIDGDIAALASVGLSQEPSLELVERAQVERVLREQQLSQAGIIDTRQAMVLGKLLGVDVFAALENSPGDHGALGLVAFDAATGRKLSDCTIEGSSPKIKADSLQAAVMAACVKRQRGTAAMRTVCLASVRNADMPREMDSLCESAGRLLERQLVQSPDITLLERERLEEINRERQLPTTTPTSDLLASLTLFELELGKSSVDSEIQASLFLSDTSGRAISKISLVGSQTNVPGLVDRLLNFVTKQLAVAPVKQEKDRAQEASYFHREAQFLMTHNYLLRGLAAAEAAYALEPGTELHQQTLASSLVEVAVSLLQVPPVAAADRDRPLPVPPELLRSVRLINRALNIHKVDVMGYLNKAAPFEGGPDAETRDLFETLQRQVRDELLRDHLVAVTNLNGFQQLTYRTPAVVLPQLHYLSPTGHEWTRDSIKIISHWLNVAKTNAPSWDAQAGPPYWGGEIPAAPANYLVAWPFVRTFVGSSNGSSPSQRWRLSAEDYAHWNELYEAMQQHPTAVVKIYGRIGRLAVDLHSTTVDTNEVIRRVGSIVNSVKQILQTLPPDSARSLRNLYYRAAIDAVDAAPPESMNTANRWAQFDRLFDFMLSQRELVEPVVTKATRDLYEFHEVHPASSALYMESAARLPVAYVQERTRNLERARAALDSAGVRLLDSKREDFQQQLAAIQRDLARHGVEMGVPQPWVEARLVFTVTDCLERIDEAIVQDDGAYLVGLGRKGEGRFVQLVRLSIPNGQVQMLGQAPHDWDEINNLGAVITGACAEGENVFVGTRRDGVFVFPTKGGSPQHLTTTNGLPSNWVRSLACVGNKLFLGLGEHEGFLVVYDLRGQRCDVIASSRRKEKRSPFDGMSPPFTVHCLRSDPLRKRVIALITAPTAPGLAGLWQIDLHSGALSQILLLTRQEWSPPNFLSPIRNNRLLLHDWVSHCIVDFDLRNDQAKLLYAGDRYGSFHSLQPAKETVRTWVNRSGPFLIVNGSMWTGEDFGRFSRDLPNGESFPALPGEQLPRTAGSMTSLEIVGNGRRVLVVQKTKVWAVTLPNAATP